MQRHKSFTLIELLVVVAIIAVLVSLLLPAIAKARQLVNDAVCLSNLRQWGLAFAMYSDENRGRMPYPYSYSITDPVWYYESTMGKYIQMAGGQYSYPDIWGRKEIANGVAVCPSHPGAKTPAIIANGIPYARSYAYNYNLPRGDRPFQNLPNYSHLDLLVILADGSEYAPPWSVGTGFPLGYVSYFFADCHNLEYRHAGRASMLFADWHVAAHYTEERSRKFITGSWDMIWN